MFLSRAVKVSAILVLGMTNASVSANADGVSGLSGSPEGVDPEPDEAERPLRQLRSSPRNWYPVPFEFEQGACRKPKQPDYESRADSFEECRDFCEKVSWCKAIEWKRKSKKGDNCELFKDRPRTVKPDSNYECWAYYGPK